MINNPAILNDYLNPQNLGEKVTLALTTLLLGMLVVFAVLTIIMLVIMLVGKIFSTIKRRLRSPSPLLLPNPKSLKLLLKRLRKTRGHLLRPLPLQSLSAWRSQLAPSVWFPLRKPAPNLLGTRNN